MSSYYQIGAVADQELLHGLANHSSEALESLYKQFYPMTVYMVVNNNGNEEDAKDIFQEAIIVLYEKANGGSFELHCKLKTFIYSVCRRLWLKRLQQRHRQTTLTGEIAEAIPVENDMEAHERKDEEFTMMAAAMKNLGEPCKSLLEDYYLHRRSMQEITEKFGYTNADNAKNQKYKCLMRLKKLFFIQYKKG